MAKLIVVIMGPGNDNFINMCYDSVKTADDVLYFSSNPDKIKNYLHIKVFNNFWDEKDKATNGKARNIYLNYLKEHYPNDWCLVLDEDEIVEDLDKIKEFVNEEPLNNIFSVKMRHLVGNLGNEDATNPIHWVPHRLFKISEVISYPLQSHPVLIPKDVNKIGNCAETTIWHLGHLPVKYLDYILKRYKQHTNDSIIHNPIFLNQWKMSHLFGAYPTKPVNPIELPIQLCKRYEIDKEEFYFQTRQTLETKHFMMVRQWLDKFNPKTVLDVGCGFGLFGHAIKTVEPKIKYTGVEISKYVADRWNFKSMELIHDDIRNVTIDKKYDLILFLDILEHLDYEGLDKVLKNTCKSGNNFIFSIPFIGDPNLESDETHIIKEDKIWWIKKLNKYFKIENAPKEWLFNHQFLIGKRK